MPPLGCLPRWGKWGAPSYPLQNVKKIWAAKGFIQSNNFKIALQLFSGCSNHGLVPQDREIPENCEQKRGDMVNSSIIL
jgi:hypothetical protein